MASGPPLGNAVKPLAFVTEGISVTEFREQVTIDVVVHAGSSERGAALEANVRYASAHEVIDGGELQLIVGEDRTACAVAAGVDGVIVDRVSNGRATGHAGGRCGDPNGVDRSICGSDGNVVVYRDVLHGVLKEDVSGNIDAEIPVERIVVNCAAAYGPSALTPEVNAVMVVGVRG